MKFNLLIIFKLLIRESFNRNNNSNLIIETLITKFHLEYNNLIVVIYLLYR